MSFTRVYVLCGLYESVFVGVWAARVCLCVCVCVQVPFAVSFVVLFGF